MFERKHHNNISDINKANVLKKKIVFCSIIAFKQPLVSVKKKSTQKKLKADVCVIKDMKPQDLRTTISKQFPVLSVA